MTTAYGYADAQPGMNDAVYTNERTVEWRPSPGTDFRYKSVCIDATAVDSANSPTTLLRPGLVMAKLAASNEWVDYDPDAADGSQEARGILVEECYLFDPVAGEAVDRYKRIMVSGGVKHSECINLDAQARAQLRAQGFVFDDEHGNDSFLPFARVVEKAADYTVVAADNGTLFLATTGAVTFTLPTKAVGLRFRFMQTTDANMVIASAGSADDIIADGDAGADSITFSTASHKIGSVYEVICAYVGGSLKWLGFNLGGTAATVA
ncbi:MAG: hypothetical protein IT428_19865 [Planctomycetaceae bacterium]|nr:hypothetical protein [Planctomycetaceae bacterium]